MQNFIKMLLFRDQHSEEDVSIGYTKGSYGGVPALTPVSFVKSEDRFFRGSTYFPPRYGFGAPNLVDLEKRRILPIDNKKVIIGHKTNEVDYFDYSKVSRIHDYVRENGALSFVVSDKEASINMTKDLTVLSHMYLINTCFYAECSEHHFGKDNDLFTFICFFDLPFAIPIYSWKKVDGMGVCFGILCKEKAKFTENLVIVARHYFVLSNREENVLVLDGSRINRNKELGNGQIERYLGILRKEHKEIEDVTF